MSMREPCFEWGIRGNIHANQSKPSQASDCWPDVRCTVTVPEPVINHLLQGLGPIKSCDLSLYQAEPIASHPIRSQVPLIKSGDSSLCFSEAQKDFERTYLTNLLQMTGGNVSEAARLSGLANRKFNEAVEKPHFWTKWVL